MLPAGVETKTPSETNFFIIYLELFFIDKFAACLLCLKIDTSLIARHVLLLFLPKTNISKGEIFIQESQVEYDKIIAKVLAVSKNRTDTRIYVRGDKTINYGRVLEIMGLLSGSGFTKVALISGPYKQR